MRVFRRIVAAAAVTALTAAASAASAEPVRPGASLVSPSATAGAVAGTRQGMRTGARLGARNSATGGEVLLFAALGIGAAVALYLIVDDGDKSSPD